MLEFRLNVACGCYNRVDRGGTGGAKGKVMMEQQNVVQLMNGALSEFRSKLETKSVQVGVVGLGYVGLPLGLLFARKGFRTTGFDIDPRKVEMLRRGESYIRHLESAAI